MIDIEKLKQVALASINHNGDNYYSHVHTYTSVANPSAVLELITRLEAAESQQVAQELVIQQLRDALEKIACIGNGDTHGNSVGNCMAIDALATPTSTVHLEAWYKEMVGPVISAYPRDGLWEPLHAIKPFPFKEK